MELLIAFLSFIGAGVASDLVIRSVRKISKGKAPAFWAGLFFIAVGTSLPEFMTAVVSSVEGAGDLSFGDAVGSNVVNVLLILGIYAVLAGKVEVSERARRDILLSLPVLSLMYLAVFLMVLDGKAEWWEGIVLVISYFAYVVYLFEHEGDKGRISVRDLFSLILSILLLVLFSSYGVSLVVDYIRRHHSDAFLLGLLFTSIGTSLPELAIALASYRKKTPALATGEILGSVYANLTLVLGTAALINPVTLYLPEFFAAFSYMGLSVLLTFLLLIRNALDRKMGLLLILLYGVFLWAI